MDWGPRPEPHHRALTDKSLFGSIKNEVKGSPFLKPEDRALYLPAPLGPPGPLTLCQECTR